jgi:N-acyl-D-amino-acid deacylase
MVIDAGDLAVSPGFIDTHAHSDFTVIADPRAEGKLCQGITSEINGNCGMSAAPLYNKASEKREEDLKDLGIKEKWNTFEEYFRILEKKGIATNLATLVGHGNIRGSVIGYEDKEPSSEEMLKMSDLLNLTVEQGVIGLSSGLIYPPGIYSKTEELIKLSNMLRDKSLIYTSHMRSEGENLLESVHEIIRIGEEAGTKVHISHLKTAGECNWHKAGEVISLLHNARKSGVKISCDRYPYTASSTELDSVLPSWTFSGGDEEEIKRLQDREEREKIKNDLGKEIRSKEYWRNIIISSVVSEKNRWMEGKTIEDISKKMEIAELDFLLRILIEERLRVGAIFCTMNEENLRKFLSLPFCMIGSDSSARCFDGITKKGKPHPRGFGTFPRFFGRYVRDDRMMSLSQAIHKATLMPAQTFGLKGRGKIKEGMYADIVIFEPEKIIDRASYENPFQKPEGIYYVLVNGIPAIWEGEVTGKLSGKILKGSQFLNI